MLSHFFQLFEIYYVIWWTVLFCVLPLGVTSYAEAGVAVTDGGDPGAPVNPRMLRKFWTTTWVSAIVFAIGFVIYSLHIIQLPDIPIK